jgi:hypothetical protein
MVGSGRMKHVAALAAGGLLLAVGVPAVEEPNFGIELDRAREAMNVQPAKAYYDGPFNKAFYAKFSEWLNQCTKSTGEPLSDFDMLITLGREGQVQALRFQPTSLLAACFGELVRKERFPLPPATGLMVPASVRITKP